MASVVPIDPAKLLEAARGFANHHGAQGRPRPIWLRRAVSSAYYALFHSIVLTAVENLLPNGTREERLRLTRSFSHQCVAAVSTWIVSGQGVPEHSQALATSLQATSIAGVADAFTSLRLARHDADYDHLTPFDKKTALAAIEDAEKGIQQLAAATDRDRQAFAALLSLRTQIR